MRPTPEETLTGAETLLRDLLEEPELSAVVTETVTDVVRMLTQARRVVADAPAFLEQDNEALRALLSELVRDLPPAELGARRRIHAYLTERTTRDPH